MIKFPFRQGARFACLVAIFGLGHNPCFAQSSNDAAMQQGDAADQQIPPAISK